MRDPDGAGRPPDQHHSRHVAVLLVHRRIRFDARTARNGRYGSGLLSSYSELQHAIESDEVQRYPLQMEWVINQVAEIDHYQPLLFIAESFDHVFELVDRLERWMREGKLNNVAPGFPDVSEEDLRSFMDAARSL